MNRYLKPAVLAFAVAATTLSSFATAEAGDRDRWRHGHRHNNNDAAWAAGAAGLVTGVIVGSAIANTPRYDDGYYSAPPRRVYVEPEYRPVRRVYRERVVVGAFEPWSPEWYDYCESTYRSFNPRSGTFVGFDGREHFCVAG